jgi:nitrous oxidase accessory protein NosD
VLPFAAAVVLAAVLRDWWPLALCGLMVAAGVALDVAVLHRLLPYQPGWAALPIGAAELGLTMLAARALGVAPALEAALAFFAAAWLVAQVLGHAVYPLAHHRYGDDGGELGRAGPAVLALSLIALVVTAGAAHATRPPIVVLERGVHGPLLLDSPQRLVAEPGAVVRGGIRITSDDVEVAGVTVRGGRYGIEVRESERVRLVGVTITGTREDGVNARGSAVTVRDCTVRAEAGRTQGIDVSFAMHAGTSRIERCTVTGGDEGIVTHLAHAEIRGNTVRGAGLRGITMTEMSTGEIEGNTVEGALGVGVFCGDYSVCKVRRNVIRDTRRDPNGDPTRAGYAIQAHYGSWIRLADNTFVRNPHAVGAFLNSALVQAAG